jgi:L,D-peptidoglycan transpeptidase YkuD (ErfK/YbiS/YcfS/YnhG family)
MIDYLRLTPMGLIAGQNRFPCSIGRGGITSNKIEGDGATPIGDHKIVGMYYRADRIAKPNHWATPIGPNDLWSDDANARDYNKLVRTPYPFSHETLRRGDPMYDLILVTDWNYPNTIANKGSAIFVHQWRRPRFPTAGCIALSRKHLWDIATKICFGATLSISARNPALRK